MEKEGRTRLLLVLRILRERTDEGHTLSTTELERILREEYGIDAYRITIQKDIAALNEAGYSIETIRSSQNKYYFTGRPFELPELKLLVDAVESSKFITERKSRALAEKLTSLASRHQASALKRNIHIADRIKAKNEQIYYIMDAINDAINQEQKIAFLYYHYSPDRRKKLKNNGKPYIFSPYTLTWNGDHYYVVGYSEKHEKLATFRVDRIYRTPEILPEKAVPRPKEYNIADFAEQAFQLFDRERFRVSLLCDSGMMNTVLDHFGEKAKVEIVDQEHFRLRTEVAASPTFFAWVFEFGGAIRIEGPQQVKDAYLDLIERAKESLNEP